MIRFIIPLPAGLHQQPKRAPIVDAIRRATGMASLPRQRYRVRFVLYAQWDQPSGKPKSNNTDNAVKILLDCMAEAFGFGKRGRGDEWLDRSYSVDAPHSTRNEADVTLTPM